MGKQVANKLAKEGLAFKEEKERTRGLFFYMGERRERLASWSRVVDRKEKEEDLIFWGYLA